MRHRSQTRRLKKGVKKSKKRGGMFSFFSKSAAKGETADNGSDVTFLQNPYRYLTRKFRRSKKPPKDHSLQHGDEAVTYEFKRPAEVSVKNKKFTRSKAKSPGMFEAAYYLQPFRKASELDEAWQITDVNGDEINHEDLASMKMAIEHFRKSKTYEFKSEHGSTVFKYKIESKQLEPGTKYHIQLTYNGRKIECDVTYNADETEEVISPIKKRQVLINLAGNWIPTQDNNLEDAVKQYNSQNFQVKLYENKKETNVSCRIHFVDIPGKDLLLNYNGNEIKYAEIDPRQPRDVKQLYGQITGVDL